MLELKLQADFSSVLEDPRAGLVSYNICSLSTRFFIQVTGAHTCEAARSPL